MNQQPSNLLFLHIAWIFDLWNIICGLGEIFGFNETLCMFFDLLPWDPIVFPARSKTWDSRKLALRASAERKEQTYGNEQ
jgi:hypothetical protein